MSEAWRIDYDNDTGPGDEGFWESWTVTNGERSFECRSQEDAQWLVSMLQPTPVEKAATELMSPTDEQWMAHFKSTTHQ